MKVIIVRHGRTQGNTERRYVGCRTDEPLLASEYGEINVIEPAAGKAILCISPMLRARQTAEIMCPGVEQTVIDDLRETDFGEFEGRTYEELNRDPHLSEDYQAWIDSGGTMKVPGGESMDESSARSMRGFAKAVSLAAHQAADRLVIIAHGGTVMAVMSSLFGGSYYDYYAGNGEGYTFELEVDDAGNITAAGTYDRFCGRILP
ncbi:MAG: histidine phosphatase family protein [Mogibacterium sp.]|nr:histidine phosphatase family protein [Mogibacterium sp.]